MQQPVMCQPTTLKEAVKSLQTRGAVPFAGATDLIPAVRKGEISPRTLVNLKSVDGMTGVHSSRDGLVIGPCTSVADLFDHELVARHAPLLSEVARSFGSVQIRTLATIGGNLCTAAPSADLALPLLALDARLHIRGPRGKREIDIANFFVGVNKTALKRGEILTAIVLPRPKVRTGTAHQKLGVRRAMDLAFVGVAVALRVAADGRKCLAARLALGSVAPVPMRARRAEALLEGKALTESLLSEAAAQAAAEAKPIDDLRASGEYRRQMTEVLTRRALREAYRRARKEQ
ncbi:MAG: xanthine dehydrogenase family protein subunit M [Armatimonadetes bacterium]|nr:xanthine dehydrogenase family protein subunit M [Armatimonadota bacterium]